jgi:hypothetical protein
MEGVSGSNTDSTNAIKTENTYKAKIVRDESHYKGTILTPTFP